ncbi:MAG TPA: LPS assembly lipoprotein LptE [Vicinamibacterales bacterium]|jgi:outer membrane lipopolysaccharide assembly protein LptE/RlpB|nr:LPS assembly lipoprotein LptE [Vicinamibacterales bacterium]
MNGRAVRLAAVVAAVVALAGCGYALAGRGNALPADIQVIGVPAIVNQSSTPDIDRVLTDEVRREFQGKGKYRILPQATGVDAVFSATITSVALRPVAFNSSNQVSQFAIVTTANVQFKDLHGDRIIWQNPAVSVTDEYNVTTSAVPNDPTALFTQDSAAFQRMAEKFAREVVTSVFEAF